MIDNIANNLGIFINNTDSELKFNINYNNFEKLKNNFDKIVVLDIEEKYSIQLKDKIINEPSIYKYILDNAFSKDSNKDDFQYNKINYILKNINTQYFNYITIISDNYIYCDNLNGYFSYVYNHNLDFYSYTDTTENEYNYQLYLFSFLSSYVNKIISFLKKKYNIEEINHNFKSIFDKKMAYIKVAYIDNNFEQNIFMNDKIHQYFINNNIIPILNINKLINIKKNFNNTIFNTIPSNFDLKIYKTHKDLKNYSDEFLYNHFLNYGQFEIRNFCEDNFIYPVYIRNLLEKCSLLKYFDVPTNFNMIKYKELNPDIGNLNRTNLLLHYIDNGCKENKAYK